MQEQVVHVPKVVQQERVSHQQVEQVVEVHVPMTQELCFCFACDIEIFMNLMILMFSLKTFSARPDLKEEVVHVPKVMQHERQHHFHVEVGCLFSKAVTAGVLDHGCLGHRPY